MEWLWPTCEGCWEEACGIVGVQRRQVLDLTGDAGRERQQVVSHPQVELTRMLLCNSRYPNPSTFGCTASRVLMFNYDFGRILRALDIPEVCTLILPRPALEC